VRLPPDTEYAPHFRRLKFRLDSGREVSLEGCCVEPSALEFLSGSREKIRDRLIERLPKRVRQHHPNENCGLFVKAVPDGELPVYFFMVDLVSYQPVSDPHADMSSLVVCWLNDDIETNLPDLIDREISSVEWDKYAVDGSV